jgi:hypothetical protein
MNPGVIDGISRELQGVSTRRSIVRLLGSAAALGAVALVGLEVEAKGKPHATRQADAKAKGKGKGTAALEGKKRKKPKHPRPKPQPQPQPQPVPVCQVGTQVTQLSVPYTGVPVLTPVLAAGQVYTVQVSGFAATNATHSVDAEYDFLNATPATIADANATVDVGLSIDDATTDLAKSPKWGPYNPAHVYSQKIIGQGRPASLLMQDSAYGDNSGAVTVTITCG